MGTPPSLHAWKAAHAAATELSQRADVVAVAVTGSLARGDFSAGSDVDLWVIGSKDTREERQVEGVAVSLLWSTPHRARSDDALLRFEVADLVLLVDPLGFFRGLQDLAVARQQPLEEFLVQASAAAAQWLLGSVGRTAGLDVAALRELAHRGAALGTLLDRGWRVPRLRQFQRVMSPGAFRRLQRILGLPKLDARVLPLLTRARRGRDAVPGMPLPEEAEIARYLAAGRTGDAAIALRKGLPPAPQSLSMTAGQRALFQLVQGDTRKIDRVGLAGKVFDHLQELGLLDTLGIREQLGERAQR